MSQKQSIQNASCPRLSGKVSAELTKGARVSRNVRIEISVSRNVRIKISVSKTNKKRF